MSEVRTLKCDICGKVYHEDENCGEFMHIEHEFRTREEGSITHYEHICPNCLNTVLKVIEEPDIIQEMELMYDRSSRRLDVSRNYISNLEDIIFNLRCRIVGPISRNINLDDGYRNTYFKNRSDEINIEYDKLKDSRNLWKASALGLLTGMLIALMLKLIF